MEQDRPDWDVAAAAVWAALWARAEAAWAAHLPQDRVEVAYARTAQQ